MESLAKQKLLQFFRRYKKVAFKKREIILRADQQEIRSIIFIEKGSVRQYHIAPNGEETTLHEYFEGSFFPIMLVLAKHQNTYYFEAVEPTFAYIAPAKDVVLFLKKNPDVLYDLTVRFAHGLNGLLQKVERFTHEHAYQKVISTLLFLIKHHAPIITRTDTVTLCVTHSEIASWIGTQRETVSRQLEKLQKKGIIQSKNHQITIKSLILLQKELR